MEAIAPLMGIPMPAHLVEEAEAARAAVRPFTRIDEAFLRTIFQLPDVSSQQPLTLEPRGPAGASNEANWRGITATNEGAVAAAAPPRTPLLRPLAVVDLIEPDVSDLNAFDDGSDVLPPNASDWQGPRYRLARPLKHKSRIAKRRVLNKLADELASDW